MKRFRGSRELLEYGVFFAALLPTLAVLLAAGICLAGGDGARALTMPAVPIYTPG